MNFIPNQIYVITVTKTIVLSVTLCDITFCCSAHAMGSQALSFTSM